MGYWRGDVGDEYFLGSEKEPYLRFVLHVSRGLKIFGKVFEAKMVCCVEKGAPLNGYKCGLTFYLQYIGWG